LAKSLGLEVVAEGVEGEDAFTRLRSLGCDQMQGFYFGEAMSGEELLTWLKESPWGQGAQQDPRLAPA
ncbi:MAG: EAL domain-containing protein, partial [Geminicoccales bacterium]